MVDDYYGPGALALRARDPTLQNWHIRPIIPIADIDL